MKTASPRWIALQVVSRVVDRGRSLDDIFASDWFRSLNAAPRDLAFGRELAYGLCRWYHALSAVLRERLKKPLRARDRDIEIALLIGLYQILVAGTDAHAAVNETVQLAHFQGKGWAHGLVNALLRGVIRDRVALDDRAQAASYPAWFAARIERDWGARAEELLRAGNERAPMTLRVDTRRVGRDDMLARLARDAIEATPHPRVESAIQLSTPREVADLPGFAEGLLSVQDAAAQLAALLLPCDSGQRVLDACAAPGGKAMHLLQHHGDLDLDLLDSNESRLERVRDNLARIGRNARILTGDAATPGEWHDGEAYDCILADVPCSASGVIRRHPDIKLLRRENDIMPLLTLQGRILDALWGLLKPGGSMLYCTCSIFRDENENQIRRFLERHLDGIAEEPAGLDWARACSPGRQILTGSDAMDGFYYARLTRGKSA